MKLRHSALALAALLAACSEGPTEPATNPGITPQAAVNSSAAPSVFDDFIGGADNFTACGSPVFRYIQDGSIIGGAREVYARDAGSCIFGPRPARLTINTAQGAMTWGGLHTYSAEHAVKYGTMIGFGYPYWMFPPNRGRGVPLNLSLNLSGKIRIEMAQVYGGNPSVLIVLKAGNGAEYGRSVPLHVGINLIPVSSFGMSAQAAADIDGIGLTAYGMKDPGHVIASLGYEGSDNTPPAVVADVSGTQGANGWYTSDVAVSWSVSDSDSPVSSQNGCSASSVTTDSDGQTFTCSATSAGGTNSQSVTIKRDATAPTVTYTGNAGSYSVDQTIAISCAANDATNPGSGLASSTCANVSGAAYTFAASNDVSADAVDNAGNAGSGSTSFTVVVNGAGLCALTTQWVQQAGNGGGVANSLCAKLRNGQVKAYINEVGAQSGKKIAADKAAILIALAQRLP